MKPPDLLLNNSRTPLVPTKGGFCVTSFSSSFSAKKRENNGRLVSSKDLRDHIYLVNYFLTCTSVSRMNPNLFFSATSTAFWSSKYFSMSFDIAARIPRFLLLVNWIFEAQNGMKSMPEFL